jgi:hypothetical protein
MYLYLEEYCKMPTHGLRQVLYYRRAGPTQNTNNNRRQRQVPSISLFLFYTVDRRRYSFEADSIVNYCPTRRHIASVVSSLTSSYIITMSRMKEFHSTAPRTLFSKSLRFGMLCSHLFLLLTFLLSTICLCSSSEELRIIDPILSGQREGPLSTTSIAQSQPHRQLIKKEGYVSLLVVRVSGLDKSPSMDKAFLYNSIFDKEASLRWQYHKCSAESSTLYPPTRKC